MPTDSKYLVYKKGEFVTWAAEAMRSVDPPVTPVPEPLPDAVVIRTQDVFAGPALHSYAAAIAIAMKFVPKSNPVYADMEIAADYFHECAMEADLLAQADVAKVPD